MRKQRLYSFFVKMDEHPIIWLAIIGCLLIFVISFLRGNCEVNADNYDRVAFLAKHEKELCPQIKEALKDHVLTKREYSSISKSVERLYKTRLIKKALKHHEKNTLVAPQIN